MKKFKLKLSIIVPVYNEKKTINQILIKINKLKSLKKEIIVVDDGSKDGTDIILKKNIHKISKLIHHKKNKGKGAAIKTAQKFVTGEVVIIQDADLEYDPNDYTKLLNFFNKGHKVVYGSRVLGKNRYLLKNFSSFMRIFYNHFLTILSNLLNNQNLTDAHTCYKVFESKLFKKIKLEEEDFAFCPEVTSKISKLNEKILEVSINYKGRSKAQGKKIGLIDGFRAIYVIIKYRLKI